MSGRADDDSAMREAEVAGAQKEVGSGWLDSYCDNESNESKASVLRTGMEFA